MGTQADRLAARVLELETELALLRVALRKASRKLRDLAGKESSDA